MSERITRGVPATLSLTGHPDLKTLALLSYDAAVQAMIRVVLVLDEEPLADLKCAGLLLH